MFVDLNKEGIILMGTLLQEKNVWPACHTCKIYFELQ